MKFSGGYFFSSFLIQYSFITLLHLHRHAENENRLRTSKNRLAAKILETLSVRRIDSAVIQEIQMLIANDCLADGESPHVNVHESIAPHAIGDGQMRSSASRRNTKGSAAVSTGGISGATPFKGSNYAELSPYNLSPQVESKDGELVHQYSVDFSEGSVEERSIERTRSGDLSYEESYHRNSFSTLSRKDMHFNPISISSNDLLPLPGRSGSFSSTHTGTTAGGTAASGPSMLHGLHHESRRSRSRSGSRNGSRSGSRNGSRSGSRNGSRNGSVRGGARRKVAMERDEEESVISSVSTHKSERSRNNLKRYGGVPVVGAAVGDVGGGLKAADLAEFNKRVDGRPSGSMKTADQKVGVVSKDIGKTKVAAAEERPWWRFFG